MRAVSYTHLFKNIIKLIEGVYRKTILQIGKLCIRDRTKAVLESLGYLAPWVSVRAVGGTEISDTMLRNAFVFSKEALGQSGSGSVLSNQRAWAELLSAEDVETKHRQTSEEEQSVDVTTGSKEYTNIMEVFPAQELVVEDGTLCISVTDLSLIHI